MVCLHRNPKKILFPKESTSGMLSSHNFRDTSKAWFPWSPFSYFLFYFIKFCSFLPQKKENIILGLTLFCSFEDQLHLSIHSMWNLWKKLSQCFHFLSSSVLLTWVSSGFNNHQNTTITFSKITWNLLKIAFILKLCSFACYCSSFLPEPAFSYLVLSAFLTVLLFRAVIICLPKTLQRWYYLNLYP